MKPGETYSNRPGKCVQLVKIAACQMDTVGYYHIPHREFNIEKLSFIRILSRMYVLTPVLILQLIVI